VYTEKSYKPGLIDLPIFIVLLNSWTTSTCCHAHTPVSSLYKFITYFVYHVHSLYCLIRRVTIVIKHE